MRKNLQHLKLKNSFASETANLQPATRNLQFSPMPLSKTELFKPRDVRVAALAKALAHPARVAILRELAARNECVCGEIVSAIPLAQATVSQHLKELKNAGLIQGETKPPKIKYCINRENWALAQKLFIKFFDE